MGRYINENILLADILDEKIHNKTENAQIALSHFERMVKRCPSVDVVPIVIVNQIFEDIFLCSEYENGKLVVSHDNIVKIKNKYQRRLKL